jgi:hypothetical protein
MRAVLMLLSLFFVGAARESWDRRYWERPYRYEAVAYAVLSTTLMFLAFS